MQPQQLTLVVLTLCSATLIASAEDSTKAKLGFEIYKKQETCERIIAKEVDKILSRENPTAHDFPIANSEYHKCKKELDTKKREYMATFAIDMSSNVEFFPIVIEKGKTELISAPAKDGTDTRHLEFDENEELCVTSDKCTEVLDDMEKDEESTRKSAMKFAHCHILLDEVKQKYVRSKRIDEQKVKDEGGLSVRCLGKMKKLSTPEFMNNLGFHTDPLRDAMMGDAPTGSPPLPEGGTHEDVHQAQPGEEKQSPHVHEEEPKKDAKGKSSNAITDKANIVSVVLVVLVFYNIV